MERTVSIRKIEKPAKAGFFLYNFFVVVIVFTLLLPFETTGQEKTIKIYPTAGITWRSAAMNFLNFKAVIPADPTKPYHSEKNVQGFSLNPGIKIESKIWALEYYSNLRYDVISGIIGSENEYVKEFIADHNFNLILKRNIEFGFGMSIVNTDKGYEFVNPIPRYHNIQV